MKGKVTALVDKKDIQKIDSRSMFFAFIIIAQSIKTKLLRKQTKSQFEITLDIITKPFVQLIQSILTFIP